MTLIDIDFQRKTITMEVENENDEVQRHLLAGSFYEERVLLRHSDFIEAGGTVIDVGANIGNHTVFYANFTRATKIYCLEPNPVAQRLLRSNATRNDPEGRINLDHVAYGAGARRTTLRIEAPPEENLGAARLSRSGSGLEVEVVPLDDLFPTDEVSFIKIDVEGMEIDVLKGLQGIVNRSRPAIHLEMLHTNTDALRSFLIRNNYFVADMFRHYKGLTNYIIAPDPKRFVFIKYAYRLLPRGLAQAIPKDMKAKLRKSINS